MKGMKKGNHRNAVSGSGYPVKKVPSNTGPATVSGRNTTVRLERISISKGRANQSPDLRGAHNAVLPNIKKTNKRADKGKNYPASSNPIFDEILEGNLTNLPKKPPSEVRIFLSSTFSDMRTERNWLAKEAYPKLKEYCYNELHVDFSVVDMRWGVTDDAVNEHITEELCMREITNCQRIGLGPTFVTILGDRYGFRPLPAYITELEFDTICKESVIFEKSKQDLLKQWYLRDDNMVPPSYVLQPISSIIPGFGDHSNETTAKQAKEQWNTVMASLLDMIRLAVDSALKKGLITPERRHQFYNSITEQEISKGLFQSDSPNSHCLAFVRRFNGLDGKAVKDHLESAQRYIDIKPSYGNKVIDMELEHMRNYLSKDVIPKYLAKDKIYQYQLNWQPEGVKPEKYEEHLMYAVNFCGDFINGILTLIGSEKHKLENQIQMSEYFTDYQEVLHHLHFSKKKAQNFKGQTEVLKIIKNALLNFKNRSPLVIYAESGCGKTSVMAEVFHQLPKWFAKEDIQVTRIIRFCGTSPYSSGIYEVLRGIAGQVADVYKQIMEPVGYRTMKGLLKYLPRFLRNVSRTTKDHIVILIDSIDQLSTNNEAYKMKWLPTDLPSNVHLIISMLPNHAGIFENTKQLHLPKESFIEIKPLEEKTGKDIITSYLKDKKRTLTSKQEELILQLVQRMPNPLYLKIVLDRAVTWRSYTDVEGLEISGSVRGVINQLFTDLEQRFGQVLISHTLGYITVGLNGLSEVEIEDVLSCDDEVLNEVYRYHNPPVEGIVRIPPVLWARVRNEITEYLTERSSQLKNTQFWYHRQFIEAAEDRYTQGDQGLKLHKSLSELYQSETAMLKDITLSRRKLTIPDADRQITGHPLVESNVRTLMALPYHLRGTCDLDMLKDITLCSLKFLMIKIKSLGIEAVLKDFRETNILNEKTGATTADSDVTIVQKCLDEMVKQNKKSDDLPAEILARIPDDDYWLPYATKLVRECRIYLQNEGKPKVIPLYPCLYDKAALVDCVQNIEDVLQHKGDIMLVQCLSQSEKLSQTYEVLDLKETSLRSLLELNGGVSHRMSHDAKYIYTVKEPIVLPNTKKPDSQSNMQMMMDECILDKKENAVQNSYKINFSRGQPLDEEYQVKCFDVNKQNSMMFLGCLGNSDVVIVNISKDEVVANYKVVTKRISSAITNQILAQGDEPEFIFCSFVQQCLKTVIVIQSKEGDSHWTTLNVNTVAKPAQQTIQIPGALLNNKWYLINEENYFILPVHDLTKNTTRITVFDIVHGKHQSLKVSSLSVIDISVSCIGGLKAYLLTNAGIQIFDLIEQCEIASIDCMSSDIYRLSPCCITVEEDSQYAYVGHTDGIVRAWKIDEEWEQLGHVNFDCRGQIRGIYMSNTDSNVLIHGHNNALFSMDQTQFLEQCKRNLLLLKTARKENQQELVTLKTANLLLFSHSDVQPELITCETGGFQYWDLGAMENEKHITYGKSFEDFLPNKVTYHSDKVSPKCLLYDKQHAVIVDINNAEVDFKISIPGNGVVSATSCKEGFYIVTHTDNKIDVNLIDAQTGEISKRIRVKDTLKSDDVEVKVTANGKFLVFKVLCSDKELEIIRQTEKKSGNMKISQGKHKLYGLDLQKATGALIPCYRQLTKVTCLVDSFETWKDSMMLLGRMRVTTVWDVSTGSNDAKIIKGTRRSMFFRPIWIEEFEEDWDELCYGQSLCMHYAGPTNNEVLAIGSTDGWLMVYDYEGRSVCEKPGKVPNNSSPVESVCVSPDALWVASVTSAHVLKCWSVADSCAEIFSIKLNVKVKQLTFDPSGEYLGVLGERNDGSTKVLLFHMFKGNK